MKQEGTVTLGDLTTRHSTGGRPVWILIQQTTYEEIVLILREFKYGLDVDWMVIKELLILCVIQAS